MNNHLTMQDSLSAFVRNLEGLNRSPETIRSYRSDLMGFFIWLAENNLAAVSPDRIKRIDITEYLASLGSRGISGQTMARKVSAVREYFRYLVVHECIERSPADGVETPKREKRIRNCFTPTEYNTILSLAGSNVRDYALFQVLLQTGIRLGELVALDLGDIDLREKILRVKEGKGKQGRMIALEEKALKALRNYLSVRPRVYTSALFLNRHQERLGERGVQKLVAKYLVNARIEKRASTHSFRHTFGTMKAQKGVDVYHLQAMMGHTSILNTQIYIHGVQRDDHRVQNQTSL
jgi:site-specific recombinase XerD